MRLIECYIENFGKISARKISFDKGLNCIKDDNGSGKTTLATFIKVMLYGMSDTKKTSLEENDRKHYLPWNGGACGGSLTFTTGDKTYRIQRSFAPKAADDSFALYDTATGRECSDFTGNLGAELFGIDADGFERTVFLSERSLTPKSENKTISAKLSDLVGCDGDIGEMDSALKNLENQRKFYHKKGGAGEISDVKAKITEITKRLDALTETEAALEFEEKKARDLSLKITEARGEATRLMAEREKAAVKASNNGYEKSLKETQGAIDESIRRRNRLLEFFGGVIPSFTEIDEASYKSTEAKNLVNARENSTSGEKYKELRSFFYGKATSDEVEKIRTSVERLKEMRLREKTPGAERAREIFSRRIPSREEVEGASLLLTSLKGKKPVGAFILCALMLIGGGVGAALISPLLIGLCALGVVIAIVALAASASKKKKAKRKILAFLDSVTDINAEGDEKIREILTEMSTLISLAEMLPDKKELSELEHLLDEFVARFDYAKEDTLTAAEELIKKHGELVAMEMAEKYIRENREEATRRAEKLSAEARAFVSRFRVSSTEPFTEIRDSLTEYNRLTAEITARTQELNDLKSKHALGEDEAKRAREELEEIGKKRVQVEEKIASLSRELALCERTCKAYSDELDGRDELSMRLLELEDALARHTENFETVVLTKKYLTIARDNMTARYIGKTKESFLKYTAIISGSGDGQFEMDTDFGVSKIEGASTKTVDAYSRGTRDLYNLASRLALVDSLYEGEKPFIILDDPFTAMDDGKISAALKLLKDLSKERQIIYFTCSASRATRA